MPQCDLRLYEKYVNKKVPVRKRTEQNMGTVLQILFPAGVVFVTMPLFFYATMSLYRSRFRISIMQA